MLGAGKLSATLPVGRAAAAWARAPASRASGMAAALPPGNLAWPARDARGPSFGRSPPPLRLAPARATGFGKPNRGGGGEDEPPAPAQPSAEVSEVAEGGAADADAAPPAGEGDEGQEEGSGDLEAETVFRKKRGMGKKAREAVQANLQRLVAESEAAAIAASPVKDFKTLKAEEVYGPKKLLLVGFKAAEAEAVRGWFGQMDPSVAVDHVTDGMLGLTMDDLLWGEAKEEEDKREKKPKVVNLAGVPRVCIFAGISGEETVAVIEVWEAVSGLAPPLFATATLGNAEAPLRVVLEEMAGAATDAGEEAPRAKPGTKVITMGPKGKKGDAK